MVALGVCLDYSKREERQKRVLSIEYVKERGVFGYLYPLHHGGSTSVAPSSPSDGIMERMLAELRASIPCAISILVPVYLKRPVRPSPSLGNMRIPAGAT